MQVSGTVPNYKSSIHKINQRWSYLDLGLDVLDGVRGLHLQGDGLASQGLHEDLHGDGLL